MQRTGYFAGAVCGLVMLAQGTVAQAVDMRDGEWVTTVETTIEGGGMNMAPMTNTSTNCLTKDEPIPDQNQGGAKGCKMLDQKISGNTVSWRMVCTQDGTKIEGAGEMTYHGSSYEGTMKTTSMMEGQKMTAHMKLSGRYVGPCTGKKGATSSSAAQGNAEAEKYKVMSDQAMARGNQEMAKYQAASAAGGALMGLTVPAADPSACRQQGFAAMAECAPKVGTLPLQPGLYRVTTEKAASMPTGGSTPVDTQEEEICLSPEDPVPSSISGAHEVQQVKRSKDKINWDYKDAQTDTRGGITYQGSGFSGVVSETVQYGPDMKMNQVTKVTGRRIGDGNCGGGSGRAYTAKGRSFTSAAPQPAQAAPSAAEDAVQKGQEMINNPVKGVRNLLGF